MNNEQFIESDAIEQTSEFFGLHFNASGVNSDPSKLHVDIDSSKRVPGHTDNDSQCDVASRKTFEDTSSGKDWFDSDGGGPHTYPEVARWVSQCPAAGAQYHTDGGLSFDQFRSGVQIFRNCH